MQIQALVETRQLAWNFPEIFLSIFISEIFILRHMKGHNQFGNLGGLMKAFLIWTVFFFRRAQIYISMC